MSDLKIPAGTTFDSNRAEYCISVMFDAAGKTGCNLLAAACAQVDEGGGGCRARGAAGERGGQRPEKEESSQTVNFL